MQLNFLLAQAEDIVGLIFGLVYLAFIVLTVAAIWIVFNKANQPGWGILIPIYNLILMLRVAGKPTWWIILLLIPIVSLVAAILVAVGIARNFGKGAGFGVGLAFLPFIFYPILAFSEAEYNPVFPDQRIGPA